MKDLSGVEDSDDSFTEIETSSRQHIHETAGRAVRTRRGTLREFQDRYVDLAGFAHKREPDVPAAIAANSTQDDLEQDARIERATVTFSAPGRDGRTPFKIDIKTTAGAMVETEGLA
jgi:hypothetical protein